MEQNYVTVTLRIDKHLLTYAVSALRTFGDVAESGSSGHVDGDGGRLVAVEDVDSRRRQRRSTIHAGVRRNDRQLDDRISLVVNQPDHSDDARHRVDCENRPVDRSRDLTEPIRHLHSTRCTQRLPFTRFVRLTIDKYQLSLIDPRDKIVM